MLTVEEPLYLIFLLMVIPGIYFSHHYRHRGGVIPYPLGLWQGETLSGCFPGIRLLLSLSPAAFWGGVVLLIIALAGPVKVEKEVVYLNRGMDILFVLDESPSMAAKDFPPINRFETAKALMAAFLENRENDAVGLVSFSEEAALRVPPTVDYEAFLERLDSLQIMSLGEGTSVGLGIAIGILHLQESQAQEQVMILLTDGESNSGEISPIAAARIALEMGIRIYTVGVGSSGMVALEYTDPATGRAYRGQYKSGFNDELLTQIAALTGGRYFSAPSPGALEQVLKTIDSLEVVENRVLIRARSYPLHRSVILGGFLLVMLSFSIRKIFLGEGL